MADKNRYKQSEGARPGRGRRIEKPQNVGRTLTRILSYLLHYKARLIIAAVCMVLAAAVFDFLDGLAARALDAYSDIGKELDSLCDVVSFGVLPALMLYRTMVDLSGAGVFCCLPLVLAVFSALRLAKFNVDERQHGSFLGLPTPAAAMISMINSMIRIGPQALFF